MRVGLALDLGSDMAAGPVAAQVRAVERLLRAAEAAGIDSVWLGESYHPRPESFHLPSPLLVLAHLAAAPHWGSGPGCCSPVRSTRTGLRWRPRCSTSSATVGSRSGSGWAATRCAARSAARTCRAAGCSTSC